MQFRIDDFAPRPGSGADPSGGGWGTLVIDEDVTYPIQIHWAANMYEVFTNVSIILDENTAITASRSRECRSILELPPLLPGGGFAHGGPIYRPPPERADLCRLAEGTWVKDLLRIVVARLGELLDGSGDTTRRDHDDCTLSFVIQMR